MKDLERTGDLAHVYVLQHSYDLDGCDETKFIGVYRTPEDARAAVERLLEQPGFKAHPDGFSVDDYDLNKDHWVEGFVTD